MVHFQVFQKGGVTVKGLTYSCWLGCLANVTQQKDDKGLFQTVKAVNGKLWCQGGVVSPYLFLLYMCNHEVIFGDLFR